MYGDVCEAVSILKKNRIKIRNPLNAKCESIKSGIKEESRKNERTVGEQEKSDYGSW